MPGKPREIELCGSFHTPPSLLCSTKDVKEEALYPALSLAIWKEWIECFLTFVFSDMFLAAGENLKAIEIVGQNGWVEK